ncbi:hypothetical protein [Mycobacterium sp.]|uniref:hypothetical protein n=1 Tax=Mycobacterium sp. TaxID=1785 RepID=UPI003A86D5FE
MTDQPATRAGERTFMGKPLGTVRARLTSVAVVIAAFISLFALGASVEMAVLHRSAEHARQLIGEYATAANRGVAALTSLDFAHAERSAQRILDLATGAFRERFLETADDFTKTVRESRVTTHGAVRHAAVERDTLTPMSAVVLVVSRSEVTDAAGVEQDPRDYRVIVTVTREDGQLKMSNVEFLP